jgi:choline-sulfatase
MFPQCRVPTLTLAGCLCVFFFSCDRAENRPAPDVLLVTWDTVRADHVGPGPSGVSITPSWDRVAAEGVSFDQARTPVPITLPAHATVHTGLDPHHHGARTNGLFELSPTVPTLAERFGAGGWTTGAFVSAAVLERGYGLARGFDHYDDRTTGKPGERHYAERPATATVDAALAWLEGVDGERPVFLWVHLFDPHLPYEPPPPHDERHIEDPYRGEIAYTDEQTGRLLDGWSAQGRLERSLVVLAADHGEGLGDHGELTHAFFLYDSTLRIPLAIRVGTELDVTTERASRVEAPVTLSDVAPTLADLAGLATAKSDGISLRGALAGQSVAARPLPLECLEPVYVYGSAPLFGVLDTSDHVWLDLPRRERYDVRADAAQLVDLYTTQDAGRADELFSGFDRAWPPAGPTRQLDPQTLAQLEALGYAQGGTTALGEGGRDPKDLLPVAQLVMGQGLDRTPEEALERAQALTEQLGPLPALALYHADRLTDLGRRQAAIAVLEASAAAHPEELRLAQVLDDRRASREGDERLAVAIREALDARPDHPTARFDLALVTHRLERWDEAIALYREVLALTPADDEARLMHARAVGARQGPDAALAILDEGRARTDHSADLDCAAGSLMAWYLDRPQEARAALIACRDAGETLSARERELLAGSP